MKSEVVEVKIKVFVLSVLVAAAFGQGATVHAQHPGHPSFTEGTVSRLHPNHIEVTQTNPASHVQENHTYSIHPEIIWANIGSKDDLQTGDLIEIEFIDHGRERIATYIWLDAPEN